MALTLKEAAELSGDALLTAPIEVAFRTGKVLRVVPFVAPRRMKRRTIWGADICWPQMVKTWKG